MRVRQLAWVALLCGLLGCGQERVTWLSEGEGPANLEPLQPGWTASRASYENSFALAKAHRFAESINGEAVIAIDEDDAFSGMATVFGWERNDTVFTSYRDEGLWVLRQTPDSFADGAVLHVPNEVRVGMKWRNGSKEGGLTYEVVGRVEGVPTSFGPRTMWGIRSSAAGFDDVVRYYFEGLGLREATNEWNEDTTPRTWIGASLGQAVDAPPSPARSSLSAITIFPTVSEDPTVHRAEAWMPRGVILEPNGTVQVQFDTWEFLASPARQAWCIGVDGSSASITTSNFCNAPENRLAPPHRWVFDGSGQAYGALAEPAFNKDPKAMFLDSGGGPLIWNDDDQFGEALAGVDITIEGEAVGAPRPPVQLEADGRTPFLTVNEDWVGWGEIVETPEGWTARFEPPYGSLPAPLVSVLTPDERRYFTITADGALDEWKATDTGVEVTRLARYEIPDEHVATLGAVLPDRVLVLTAIPDPEGVSGDRVFMWEAGLPGAGSAWNPAGPTSIYRELGLNEVRLCWPPTDDVLDTSDWRMGERGLSLTDSATPRCASAATNEQLDPGQAGLADYSFSGTVPGIGPVLLSLR